jgi:hypothetical protein
MFLKPNPLVIAMIAQYSLKKELLQQYEFITPQNQDISLLEIKDHRPDPPDNGAIEEKPRPHAHPPSGHDKRPCS